MNSLDVAKIKMLEQEGYISLIVANRLTGVPKKDISKVVREGHVLSREFGGRIFVNKEQLLKHYDKPKEIKLTEATYNNLLLKVDKLERKVSLLERAFDLYYQPLELSDRELHAIYLEAKKLRVSTIKQVVEWSEVLCRLTEKHLYQLKDYTKDEDCWKPFIELAYILCYFTKKSNQVAETRKLAFRSYRNIKLTTLVYLHIDLRGKRRVLFNYKEVVNKVVKSGIAKRWKKERHSVQKSVSKDINIDDLIIT